MPLTPGADGRVVLMDPQPLALADAAAMAALETVAVPWPWSPGQYADSLAAGHFGWCRREQGALLGFILFMQVLDEATLLNLVVNPARQRAGLGRGLLRYGLEALRAHAVSQCLLEVRVSNSAAIALYRQLGFQDIGLRKGYYPAGSGREDALVMRRSLDEVAV